MSNAASGSKYEKMSITKDGREVNLVGKVTSFDYYESLLSPNITATMSFIDTGNAIESNRKTDRQERVGSIYNSLPITGEEQIKFKITNQLGTLDFIKTPLLVNNAVNLKQESERESVGLNLISDSGIRNHSIPLSEEYTGLISNSVKKILKESFGLPDERINVDKTQYPYNFKGYNKTPFENLLKLAPKSTVNGGDPGYFFYETRKGMNFKSIDSLIKVDPKQIPVYYYSGGLKSSVDSNINDNKIISYTIGKNQNIINALRSGVYESRNVCWNPLTFEYVEFVLSLSNNELKVSLGSEVPKLETSSNNYSRTYHHILDVGFQSQGIDFSVNNNPCLYVAKSTMRYNLLMSQVINMTIPCNPNLVAGDIIRCEFEKITKSEKEQGGFDQNQSGNYMILNLSHHFEPNKSYTGLTLVRDSFGIYTNKNKE